ncbi:MAG: c-type cytochrome domain-containing protein [Tunicatimonas sp.]
MEAEATIPATIDFNLHVKPILSDRCFACHGPDAANQQADLRLDTKAGLFAALTEGDGHVIVPGSLRRGAVYQRIVTTDPKGGWPGAE